MKKKVSHLYHVALRLFLTPQNLRKNPRHNLENSKNNSNKTWDSLPFFKIERSYINKSYLDSRVITLKRGNTNKNFKLSYFWSKAVKDTFH